MQKRFLPVLMVALASLSMLSAQAPQPDPKDPQYQAKGDQKRTYMFPGGCVTYDFRFRQLKPSIVDEGAMAVGFVSRAEVEARYHEVAK